MMIILPCLSQPLDTYGLVSSVEYSPLTATTALDALRILFADYQVGLIPEDVYLRQADAVILWLENSPKKDKST